MQIKSIQTTKTARYILSDDISKKTKNVWIICHGYGQSAAGFLKWFIPIFNDETVFIAPEGLSKFYWKGFNGKVVSSWMTKENRENEIDDYINFLEKIVDEIKPKLKKNIRFHALGFSQGTSTIARWANSTSIKLSSISLWSGEFPDDLLDSWNNKSLPKINFFFGDQDPFISDSKIKHEELKLNKRGIIFNVNIFKGKHKIEEKPLLFLKNKV